MLASQRFETIVNIVNEKGIAKTSELAQLMDVTETTIRRDCEELEQQGKIIRVHGGAKCVEQSAILTHTDEKKMSERTEHLHEKELVCRRAAAFVHDGDCIYIDGGTTLVPMLRFLKGKNIKIVTHNVLVANTFDDTMAELFMVGGRYIPEYQMCVGPITLKNLAHFNFDHAFLGCAGFDAAKQIVYTAEMETMAVKEAVMEHSVKRYLLIDDSKLTVKGFYNFSTGAQFDAVICSLPQNRNMDDMPDNFIFASEDDF